MRNGLVWSHQHTLHASDVGIGDGFGFAVAISGESIVSAILSPLSGPDAVAPAPPAGYAFMGIFKLEKPTGDSGVV